MVINLKEYGLYDCEKLVEVKRVEKFEYDQEDYLVFTYYVGCAIAYSTRDNTVILETDNFAHEWSELDESDYDHEEIYKILSGLRNPLNEEL